MSNRQDRTISRTFSNWTVTATFRRRVVELLKEASKQLRRVRPGASSVRDLTSLTLMATLLFGSLSPASIALSRSEQKEKSFRANQEEDSNSADWLSWLTSENAGPQQRGDGRGMPSNPVNQPGARPEGPKSKAEKEVRVASLRINPSTEVTLQSREPLQLIAIPLDEQESPIQGLQAEWESSDKQVVFVTKSGRAVGGKPGKAKLIARAGKVKQSIDVTVVEGIRQNYGGKKREDSKRPHGQGVRVSSYRQGQALRKKEVGLHHPSFFSNVISPAPASPLPLRPPNDDPLPDNETSSLYQASNAIGSPPGRRKLGAMTPAAAEDGSESGNKNFTFNLPIVGLAGRGLSLSLGLVYNSLVFNKSTDPYDSSTWMTYDVDSSWPATGWRITLGQIEDQGSNGFTLTDADGTRHALVYSSAYNYDSTDGTFIHFTGGSGWGTLYYPNGTRVNYGAAGGGYRSYPTQITDRNGNYMLISYAGTSGAGPKISSIEDTLGRYVNFYYASNGDLVTITTPGMTCSSCSSERQVMRFYYTDVTLGSSLFASGVHVNAPTSVHTLQYIYLPNSVESGDAHVGYRFDYSPYGMVNQITKFHGMTVSSSSNTTAGSVTTEGSQAAVTSYDYPTTGSSLTDVPTYSHRTDDWAGRTTGGSAPSYTFSVNESTGVSTVTAPDGTVTETDTIVDAGQWDDGLLSDIYVKNGSTSLSHTKMDWQQDSNSRNARIYQIRTTDDVAHLTKATVLTYTSYNNLSVVSERDFTSDGTVSSTELRRTETTYVTSSSYTGRYLLHLPSMIKVFPGGSSTLASRVDYAYDEYGTGHANLTSRDDIIMHDPAFDPFQPTQESCDWVCHQYDPWWVDCIDWEYDCTYYNPYDATTDYRGNVTSVTTYPDATSSTGAITHATTYDIAGNVMTAQVDCCTLKSFTYSGAGSGGNHDYAYPISFTSGNPSGLYFTTSASYDYNTGLIASTTDENSQTTNFYYNSDSLRLEHAAYPDGGATYLIYSDGLTADGNGKYHFYVETSAKLDANGSGGATRYVNSYSFMDGRGAVARTFSNYTSANGWSTRDVEYDSMGRAYRASNPYYSSGYSTSINPDGFWTTSTFDHLGRVTQVTMPRGDNDNTLTTSIQSDYSGVYTTVTDQAGKQRRQKVDALGRVVRVDEPDSSGNLGTTGSPNQATDYYYDALDNLVRISQGTQNRYFKYDSLSRLIREREVEQATNSAYDLSDSLTGNSSWSRKTDYNSSSEVTDAYDARGVHTQFSYDDLHRVTQISYSDSTPTEHYYYDSQTLPSGAPTYTHGYATGRLIAMTYGSGAAGTYYGYDSMGRVNVQRQVTGSATYTLAYTYNYAGMLTSETYPTSRTLSYGYDEGARLASISDGTTAFASSFAYAPHGALSSETWGNGAVHSLAYNRRLQPSEVKLKQSASGNDLQRYVYSYGQVTQSTGSVDTSKNNGQIGRIDGFVNGGSTKEWDQRFIYDSLGRLSTAAEYQQGSNSSLTWQAQYTYDRWGNRYQSGSGNTNISYVSVTSSDVDTATNRFVSTGSTPTTYDAAGNITQDTKFRGMNYSYDANGRQYYSYRTDYTDGETSTYDCAGHRVQTASYVTRTMVYDIFRRLVADYTGSSGSTLERENIYRGGQLLAVYEPGGSCYKSITQFVQDFYQGVLQRQPTSTELSNWVATLSQAQAQGHGQLIAATQSLGAALFTSTEYANLGTSNAQYVTDLYAGYLGRSPDSGGYNAWLSMLNGGTSRADVRNGFAYSSEFQADVTALCVGTASTSANIKYVLSDAQGSTRAAMNNSGSGSSTVISRHDYLPFGEEIWAGTGTRTTSQGYNATDAIRQKYGQTERDEANGLDHMLFRKYESFSGRMTSPDPYKGSMRTSSPQSFNRYSYVGNDPVNFIDPSGLLTECFVDIGSIRVRRPGSGDQPYVTIPTVSVTCFDIPDGPTHGGGTEGGGGGGGGVDPKAPQNSKSACGKFVDQLVIRATVLAAFDGIAMQGRTMAYAAKNSYGKSKDDKGNNLFPIDGFKDALVSNGQGADVYKHILGAAGAIMIGDSYLVPVFGSARVPQQGAQPATTGNELYASNLAFDMQQSVDVNHPEHMREAMTEVADDIAAGMVGTMMLDTANGKMTPEELQKKLFDLLCDK
jgi:RHS repeat-associated protein